MYYLFCSWEPMRFNLGAMSQPFKLILEVTMPALNSSLAIDNIRLVDCFPGINNT